MVTSVERGGPAAAAGLKPGDRIHQFAGYDLDSPENFRAIVLAAKSPASIRFFRGRRGAAETTLTLAGTPSRLGITWRSDDAEPGVPILNRVLAGSPADQAGLRPGDRVLRIGGREFASLDEFRTLAGRLSGPIEIEVETSGRIRVVTLHPVDQQAIATDDERPAQP